MASCTPGQAQSGAGVQSQLETMASSRELSTPAENNADPSWPAFWSCREPCLPALPATPRNVSVSNPSLGRNVAARPGSKELFWGLLCLPQALTSGSPPVLAPEGLPSQVSLATPSPPPAKKSQCKAPGLRAKFKLSQSLNLWLSHPQSCPGLSLPPSQTSPLSPPLPSPTPGLGRVLPGLL